MKWMALVLLGVAVSAAHGRTWTSTSGTQVEADYIGFKNNTVTLKKADGKIIDVGLGLLSEPDREFVRSQASPEQPAVVQLASTAPVTPQPSSTTTPQAPVKSAFSGSGGPTRSDLLTDEEIAGLKTEIPNAKETGKFEFSASFYPRRVPEAEKRRYNKKGEIPFRVTAELCEIVQEKGKMVSKRQSGSMRFYVLDEAKTVVVSKRESLDKMCPT